MQKALAALKAAAASLWVGGYDGETQLMCVWVDVGRNQELAGGSVSNATLPAGGWYAVHFEPISDSSGRYYLLTLTNAAPDETPGLQVAYALRQEYPAGKLFENDAPVDTDVLFQTGCLAGWSQ